MPAAAVNLNFPMAGPSKLLKLEFAVMPRMFDFRLPAQLAREPQSSPVHAFRHNGGCNRHKRPTSRNYRCNNRCYNRRSRYSGLLLPKPEKPTLLSMPVESKIWLSDLPFEPPENCLNNPIIMYDYFSNILAFWKNRDLQLKEIKGFDLLQAPY